MLHRKVGWILALENALNIPANFELIQRDFLNDACRLASADSG
jgi:hypothetical protein